MKSNEGYKLKKPSLVEVENHDGSKTFISPHHPKYKELMKLEQSRREEV